MSHIGVLTFPATGHLNSVGALGRRLRQRGHEVTVFHIVDVEPMIREAGLNFVQIGQREFPKGTLPMLDRRNSRLSGLMAQYHISRRLRATAAMILREGPSAISQAKIDALLIDQAELAGGTVAEHLNVPFVSVASTLPVHLEAETPYFAFNWRHGNSSLHRLRNRFGMQFIETMAGPIKATINRYRARWGLPVVHHIGDLFSKVAQISQIPAEFDFPCRKLPSSFHYTGPFVDPEGRRPVDFPWERISSDRPLIYASMGTLQNGFKHVFHAIADACTGLGAQLVVSLGGRLEPEDLEPMAGDPVLVRYAPQLELVRRSALIVTHGGLNTVLEALSNGVPMVAIPVASDQPGVGARIQWTGTGEVIPVKQLSKEKLRRAVCAILRDPSYRRAARRLQACIADANGLERAADIVEQAFGIRNNHQPLTLPKAKISDVGSITPQCHN
jgi:zeaxanthin glucosyltransferase